ncbi:MULTISPECIES: hypothetical protein [unclassified Nocardioides]|uniref:hypothetical protein n=1 Tax=unclassified Nocardioides TaxID=2615069 RepID=UPI0007017688|nr:MULTISPECIES: hypothetical protein [unclassified Nocardioides]KRA37978.1 hypothetical protein ASD81_04655 [Nocardioides sp. Root614]KRA91938.1 hypothetical protein ASD84_04920 [Nocardioides sp. Root682]
MSELDTLTPGTHHLTLRPGTPVMARSPGVLQVGLDEPALRVPDDPAVRRVLTALARPGGISDAESLPAAAADVLGRLTRAGLLVEVPDTEVCPDPALVTLRAQFGPDAVRRRASRAAATIAVRADPATTVVLEPLLDRVGLRHLEPVPGGAADITTAAHLVVTTGPLDRALLDPLVRGSVPHLLVTGAASGRRVGPFVQPGLTACLRCVDAHESLHDARRPLLVSQAASAAADWPPPVDPLLDQLALAWAVRDLLRYLEGDEPSTWSATIDIRPVDPPERVAWGRHPDCGCAWDTITQFP